MPTILIQKLPLLIIKCSKCMFCLEILVNHTMEIFKNSVPRKTYDKDTSFLSANAVGITMENMT